jgi:hypothetical protein
MKTYIIDIETAPLADAALQVFLPEFKADSRLKDPIKIAEDIKAKEASFYEKATLSPLTSEVCALGVWEVGKDEPELYCGTPEEKLINIFSDLLVYSDDSTAVRQYDIITFNGNNFDIPFLCRRALKYGKNLFSKFFRTDGGLAYDSGLLDLAAMWDCRRRDFTSLRELALHLGVGDKDKKGGELYYQTYSRDPEAAKRYLHNDLLLTKSVAQKWGIIQ